MVCSRVTEACFTKGEARTDFLLCAPCTPVPRAFGRVNYSGSYLYSSLLEGDVERWRHVLYFKLYIPCREVNLASRHCLQLFSLHFSCCTFLFLCPFVQHLIIFMPLISVLQILTLKENKHTLKKIYLFPIICPDSLSLSPIFSSVKCWCCFTSQMCGVEYPCVAPKHFVTTYFAWCSFPIELPHYHPLLPPSCSWHVLKLPKDQPFFTPLFLFNVQGTQMLSIPHHYPL